MAYENTAGIGVGKYYGPRKVGGVTGSYVHNDSMREVVFELAAGAPMTGVPMTHPLPANYLVEGLYIEVEEAFAASSTADLSIGGGAGLTTDFDLATAGALLAVVTTGLAQLSGTAAVNVVLTANANAIASATGKARVIIKYRAV
jgi:hypothetical protein